MARKVIVSIEIDGKATPPLSYLSIHQPLNGHHTFELRCPIQERDRLLHNTADACGKSIKIEIKAGSERGESHFFKGFVTGVSLSKQHGAANEVTYQGHGPTVLLDDGAHCESFEEKTLSDIAKAVAGKYNVALNVAPAHSSAIPYVVQYRESSYQFLSRLADQYGEWFFYNGSDLIFGKAPSPAPMELVFGRDLSGFDLTLNLIPTKFKWQAYDPLGHKFPESSSGSLKVQGLDDYGQKMSGASDAFFNNEPAITTPYEVLDRASLEALMKHNRAAKAGQFVVCSGSSDNHTLKLGDVVAIKGNLGDASRNLTPIDYGTFRIVKISHSTDSLGNYQNHFQAIPSSLVEPLDNPLARDPICESQLAEVLENHDPEGLGRVRVQFPWQKATGAKTPWIRVAAPGAGGGYGYYYVPEKNDQVLVSFEHNNPDKPYVLGGLYHGKAKPKGVSDKDNNKKVLQTKSGNKISLDDAGTIEIVTGGNTIVMTKGKITIKTDGDMELLAKNITITASEALKMSGKPVNVESSSEITITSTADTTIKGMNVTVEGTVAATVKAVNVEINASAIADIKGNAMVKLNS